MGTEEAILPLSAVMSIMSTPKHSARMSNNYISSSPEYAPLFLQRLKEVTGGSPFWDPKSK